MSKETQMPVVLTETLWLGNEDSLAQYIATLHRDEMRLQTMQAGFFDTKAASDEEELPYLLEKSGSIGIVSIKGPTTNRTSYWDRYDKRATYNAIREAMVAASSDPEIKKIMLDIDSGGGAVSGIADTATLIRTINDKVKPVVAFTDGNMMSAAYWLGSAAGKVYASKVAGVGSIGVIATHTEVSKMLEKEGITATVVRAGKFKALANPMEPLTDAAKAQMQAALDATYGVFVQHVADMRKTSYTTADSTMAQGREFYGEAAKTAGLVDGIETFDSVMSKLSVDKRQGNSHNSSNILTGNNAMSKQALTEQTIAAMASGVTMSASASTETTGTEAGGAPSGEADTGTTEADPDTAKSAAVNSQASAPAPSAAAPSVSAAPATPATPDNAAQASLVSYLQSQVKEKDALLMQNAIDLKSANNKLADIEASTSGLLDIAIASANNMRIALGGSSIDMKGKTATEILADHASVQAQFKTKFVAGGVAAVDAAHAKKSETVSAQDALAAARIKAAQPSFRKQ